MAGKTLEELGFTNEIIPDHVSVKEAVFPFIKFSGVDVVLGPEMKSTGEVMGIDMEFGQAFLKAQYSTDFPVPTWWESVLERGWPRQGHCRNSRSQDEPVRIHFRLH